MKDLIRKLLRENLMDEDYPSSWNIDEFKRLNSFNKRVQYCNQHLQRISSGSSRIVYRIDDEKVLKLAKNQKGLAQNDGETNWANDNYYTMILARVFDFDQENSLWVEMELARPVNKQMFRNYFGVDIRDFEEYITLMNNKRVGKRVHFQPKPEVVEILDKNYFADRLIRFIADTDTIIGDFGKLSSYGLVRRDGKDEIVLIDFGLSENDFKSYYS